MKKQITVKFDEDGYQDEFEGMTSADDLVVLDKLDFFTLDELAELQKKHKVTIELRSSDVEFFKAEAKKRKVSYQAMIRDLISNYAVQMRSKVDA